MDCLLRSEVKLCHCFLESRLRCLRITIFITIVRLNIQKNVTDVELKQTLLAKLQKQQELFTKLYTSRNGTVMISFELSRKIEKKWSAFQ